MKRVVLIALTLLLTAGLAVADTTYSTSGSFNGGGNVLSLGNGVTLTYGGLTNATGQFPPNPTQVSLGTFTLSGTASSDAPLTSSFVLTLTQSVPASGGGQSFGTGTVSGTVFTGGGTNGYITFASPTALTFAGSDGFTYTYSILSTSTRGGGLPGVDFVGTQTNNGQVTLQGQLLQTPEPASMFLLGAGILGTGLLRRRK